MYIEDRLFSETSNEILYSIKMTEDEYDLFSEFTERLYFQSAATGEYYTGKELLERAKEIQGEYFNGGRKYENGDPILKKASNKKAIRRAYIDRNLGVGSTAGPGANSMKGINYLTKNGLLNKIPYRDGSGYCYEGATNTEVNMRRAGKKLKGKFTRLLKRIR